jgi:hypothetical protein
LGPNPLQQASPEVEKNNSGQQPRLGMIAVIPCRISIVLGINIETDFFPLDSLISQQKKSFLFSVERLGRKRQESPQLYRVLQYAGRRFVGKETTENDPTLPLPVSPTSSPPSGPPFYMPDS